MKRVETLPDASLRALVASVHPFGNLAAFRHRAICELARRHARGLRDTEHGAKTSTHAARNQAPSAKRLGVARVVAAN